MNNDCESILNQIHKTAEAYLPEWRYDENDLGEFSARLFSELFSENEKDLEKITSRYHTAFLNLFDISKQECTSARGIITIETTGQNIYIKEGARVGSSNGTEFVCPRGFMAISAELDDIYNVKKDYINHTETNSPKLFSFDGENLDKTSLLFSASEMFSGGGEIELSFFDVSKKKQSGEFGFLNADSLINFSFFNGNSFSEINYSVSAENKIKIILPNEIAETELYGEKGIWIKCDFKDEMPACISSQIVKTNTEQRHISPEVMYLNDFEAEKTNTQVFGHRFTIYDCFYIKSTACFSKKGADISMEVRFYFDEIGPNQDELIDYTEWKNVIPANAMKSKEPRKIYAEKVAWEYWNGLGWKALFANGEYGECFSGANKNNEFTLNFKCPNDMTAAYVGADFGMFIRCRICSTTAWKFSDLCFMTPVAEEISLSYSYNSIEKNVDSVWLEYDYKHIKLTTNETFPLRMYNNGLTSYLCFDAPLGTGLINIYFDLGAAKRKSALCNWEYLVDGKWIPLNTIDGTIGFAQSGIITLNPIYETAEAELFGKKGVWVRIIAPTEIEPVEVKKILLNTTEIIQKKSHEPELFYIEPYQKNKAVQLTSTGIVEAEVEVFEKGEWVKWGSGNKTYTISADEGKIIFGDGTSGEIPEAANEPTIRVKYTTTDGKNGNVGENEIAGFIDPIPFINNVYNPVRTFGGSDSESDERVIERGKSIASNLEKCVTLKNFEKVSLHCDDNIIKTRCLESENGEIKLIVLPNSSRTESSEMFRMLKTKLRKKLAASMPFYMEDKLIVEPAEYIEYNISVSITIDSISDFNTIYTAVSEGLKSFLDPLCGGYEGMGYDIGELPSYSTIFGYISEINSSIDINNLRISCSVGSQEVDIEYVNSYKNAVPCAGTAKIQIDSRNY